MTILFYTGTTTETPEWLSTLGYVVNPEKLLTGDYDMKAIIEDLYHPTKSTEAADLLDHIVNTQRLGFNIMEDVLQHNHKNIGKEPIIIPTLLLLDSDLEFIAQFTSDIGQIASDGETCMISIGDEEVRIDVQAIKDLQKTGISPQELNNQLEVAALCDGLNAAGDFVVPPPAPLDDLITDGDIATPAAPAKFPHRRGR